MPKPKGNEVKINYRSVKVAILEVKQLTKIYGTKKWHKKCCEISICLLKKASLLLLWVPLDAGKTTLLNVLSSIDYISQGSITLKGKKLEKLSNKELSDIRKHDIGFIFQEYNLLHTLTVKENIMLPLTVQKLDKEHMLNRYEKVAEALNILDISDKYPSELSGGQRQRTSAARAFITLPSIIFADEPTGALDSKSTQDLLKRLTRMNEAFKSTIIMVTHDPICSKLCQSSSDAKRWSNFH